MDDQQPSRLRRPVTLGHLLVAVVATLVIGSAVTGVAVAGLTPMFSDVQPGHLFYEEIEWMGRTGVSEGYLDGTYRPDEPVTRGAMSAFMQRLFDLQEDLAVASSDSTATAGTTFAPIPNALTTVEIPSGASGYVVARFSAESVCFGAAGWCRVRLMLDDNNDGVFQEMRPAASSEFAFDSTDSGTETGGSWEAHSMERYETLSRGCTCTVRADFAGPAGLTFLVDDYALVVETDLLPSDESFGP